MTMKVGRVMLEERKVDFEMMKFRVRVSLTLIPYSEIKNPRSRLYIMKENYKIYIENKEGIWVKMGNHPITQILMT